jgi:flagellin
MGMVVNSNISSLVAQSAANATTKLQEQSMERLSTGKRINAASDDAAGIAIASRLEANVTGLNQAIRNSGDAQSLIDTAEGAMNEATNILHRVRELAVQSSNDTNSSADRLAMQSEVQQLTAELDRIATTTSWAGDKLLDGSFTNKNFQIGVLASENIKVSIGAQASADLGVFRLDSTGVAISVADNTSDHVVTNFDVLGKNGSAEATFTAASSAKSVAAAVNADSATTGVSATAVTNLQISLAADPVTAVIFNLKGGGASTAISATVVDNADLTALKDAINAVSGTTQVTAAFASTSGVADKSKLILNEADGDNITIENFGNGDTTNLSAQIGDFDGTTFATAVTAASHATTPANDIVATGTVRLESTEAFTVSDQKAGSTATTGATGYFGSSAGGSGSLTAMSGVNVGTLSGSQSAIGVIDGALASIAAARADLGAKSNRLDYTMNNLSNIVVNSTASMSRIEDADFAVETSNLTKSQILQQAATSMLAQANASKQSVLSLLQG